jgi:hypothetical protein
MLSFAITNRGEATMHTNKLWWMLALGMTAGPFGCAMDGTEEEPIDGEEEDEEDLGVAQDAIVSGVGVQKCSGGDVNVHGTSAAGNRLIYRANGNIISTSAIACSTIGIAQTLNGYYVWEVYADQQLAAFSNNKPTCGQCVAMQGPGGANPPGGGGSASYQARISYPSTIVLLGAKGSMPGANYYFGNSFWASLGRPTSYCHLSIPTYGRLTNSYGFQLVNTGSGSAWGTNAYLMWDSSISGFRAASVNFWGVLDYIPSTDFCG